MAKTIEESIDVQVPVSTAYNQWTQFEEFPRFMEGVEEVKQLDDKRLLWRTNIGGKKEEFTAHMTEQVPDTRIAWRSDEGVRNAGAATFHRLSDSTTRIMFQMEYEPEGIIENVGDFMGMTRHRIKGDLERFKDFIETRGTETGAWRGEIPRPGSTRSGVV